MTRVVFDLMISNSFEMSFVCSFVHSHPSLTFIHSLTPLLIHQSLTSLIHLHHSEIVLNIIEVANDPDGRTRSAMSKSAVEIGKKQPNLVISASSDLLIRNPKVLKGNQRERKKER
jgi:hypothetical protein